MATDRTAERARLLSGIPQRWKENAESALYKNWRETILAELSDPVTTGYTGARGAVEYYRAAETAKQFHISAQPILAQFFQIFVALGRAGVTLCLSAQCTKKGMTNISFRATGKDATTRLAEHIKGWLFLYRKNVLKDGEQIDSRNYGEMREGLLMLGQTYAVKKEQREFFNYLLKELDTKFSFSKEISNPFPEEDTQDFANSFRQREAHLDAKPSPDLEKACKLVTQIRRFCTEQVCIEEAEKKLRLDEQARKKLAVFLELSVGAVLAGENSIPVDQKITAALETGAIFAALRGKGEDVSKIKDNILTRFKASGVSTDAKAIAIRTLLSQGQNYIDLYNYFLSLFSHNKETKETDEAAIDKKVTDLLDDLRAEQIKDDAYLVTGFWEYVFCCVLAWIVGAMNIAAYGVLTFKGGLLFAPLLLACIQYILMHSSLAVIGFSFLASPIAPFIVAGVLTIFNIFISYYFGLKQTRSTFAELGRKIDGKNAFDIKHSTYYWPLLMAVAFGASSLVIFGALKSFFLVSLGLSAAVGWPIIVIVGIGVFLGTMSLLHKLCKNFIEHFRNAINVKWEKAKKENHVLAFVFSFAAAGLFTLALVAVAAVADLVGMRGLFHNWVGWIFGGPIGVLSAEFNIIYNKKLLFELTDFLYNSIKSAEAGIKKWWNNEKNTTQKYLTALLVFGGVPALIVPAVTIFGVAFFGQALLVSLLVGAIAALAYSISNNAQVIWNTFRGADEVTADPQKTEESRQKLLTGKDGAAQEKKAEPDKAEKLFSGVCKYLIIAEGVIAISGGLMAASAAALSASLALAISLLAILAALKLLMLLINMSRKPAIIPTKKIGFFASSQKSMVTAEDAGSALPPTPIELRRQGAPA